MRRRVREGSLDPARAETALVAFNADLADWSRVPVDERVLLRAAELIGRHPLRSLDAIHLASALVIRDEAPTPVRFCSADIRLNAAAEAEGLSLLPA
jgi:predicted nucleic acid-binding protein